MIFLFLSFCSLFRNRERKKNIVQKLSAQNFCVDFFCAFVDSRQYYVVEGDWSSEIVGENTRHSLAEYTYTLSLFEI